MKKEELKKIAESREFIELPLCPLCGELTDLRGEFAPCCGENTEKILPEEWVRLYPTGLVTESKKKEVLKK